MVARADNKPIDALVRRTRVRTNGSRDFSGANWQRQRQQTLLLSLLAMGNGAVLTDSFRRRMVPAVVVCRFVLVVVNVFEIQRLVGTGVQPDFAE